METKDFGGSTRKKETSEDPVSRTNEMRLNHRFPEDRQKLLKEQFMDLNNKPNTGMGKKIKGTFSAISIHKKDTDLPNSNLAGESRDSSKNRFKELKKDPLSFKNPRNKNRFGNLNNSKFQLKLQAKYQNNNAMTHTPNPKLAYNQSLHSKRRAKTPNPKATLNASTEPFIKTPLINKKFCLVLDLDETLIHFKNDTENAKFLIRPHTYDFLKNLEPFFELIIFTAAKKEYADWILDKIDAKGLIGYRFYRTHCVMSRVCHLKDISRLNRDLRQMLIVDNVQENFSLQKENGIHIKGWYGDTKDTILINLEKLLLEMVEEETTDVRTFLRDKFSAGSYLGLSLFS